MKKIGLAGSLTGFVSAALVAGVLGFAAPAQADDDGGYRFGGGNGNGWAPNYGNGRDHRNNPWIDKIVPSVKVPTVDTSVRN